MDGAAAAVVVEGANHVAQAKPTIDYIHKNLRKLWAGACGVHKKSST